MRSVNLGGLDVRLCGGTDRDGGGSGPLVVLLHGFGAAGDDLVPFHRVLDVPREVRFAFPAAPIELGPAMYGESRAWWRLDIAALEEAITTGRHRDLAGSVPDGLPEARALVRAMLDELSRELAPSTLVLGGFSQGAMLSLDVALHDPRPLGALAVLSGTFLSEKEWQPRMAARAGTNVLVSHGSHDPLLPVAESQRLAKALSDSGWMVDFVGFRGQHEIPPVVLDRLARLVRRAMGESP
jgi:phospholipase/carboxylesterase